ncbi:hypothetical protein G9C98_001718 [Cotesia typhae]|uniref:COMM domain-containing protein n=1 Tax=Cotesia typhae TaxID=2053667 RepID=A0A8J5R0S3_9HYME|nr:hypothetical protein G9C98_001718 [Cotesia typhae]
MKKMELKNLNSFFTNPVNENDFTQRKIIICLTVRLEKLTNVLVSEALQRERSTMIDFDWRIKMIMGSSHVASLKQPIVQLDLFVKDKGAKEIVNVEMDRDQLDSFIKTLETDD